MTKNDIYSDLQKMVNTEVIKDEPMSKHTSFKIGGSADFFLKATSEDEVREIQRYAKVNNIPLTIIGNGSNILVSDKGIDGIVLKIDIHKLDIIKKGENILVIVGAGDKIAAVAHILMTKGISGIEELSGIPGTIGGALTMNAGAYSKEMKDIVISTRCMDMKGNIIEISNYDQHFEYRNSIYKNKEYIILETKLNLTQKNKDEVNNLMNTYIQKRLLNQPTDFPSAGSTFKRGNGFITAKIIDECNLKGYRIGDAEVSEKHAGFIVNKGKATAKDVMDLIKYVKGTVYEKTGLMIEEEIEFIGRK